MNTNICQALDANSEEAEVENVFLNLRNGKSPGWDGITNEVFKKYALCLRVHSCKCFNNVGILVSCLRAGRWA